MRWNLKEFGGKALVLGTRTTYKAYVRWVSLRNKTKPKVFEVDGVNVADRWSESKRSYLGRSDMHAVDMDLEMATHTVYN